MGKSTFESLLNKDIVPVKVNDREYNASPRRGNFHQLGQANYGEGYTQGVFGDQIFLVKSSYDNPENPDAQSIVKTAKQFWVSGNTAIIYTPELVIFQDRPQVEDGRIVMNAKDLTAKLSKFADKEVRVSDCGTIRSIDYSFEKCCWQDQNQMRDNPFLIALAGFGAPEMLAEIQSKIGKRRYIWALGKGANNEIKVPCLGEGGLVFDCSLDEFVGGRHSFGLRQ